MRYSCQGAFLWLHTDKTVLLYSAHYDHSTRSVLFMGFKHRYVPHVNDPPSICIIPAGTISPVAFKPHYNISLEEDTSLAQYDSFIWACKVSKLLALIYAVDLFLSTAINWTSKDFYIIGNVMYVWELSLLIFWE